MKTNLVIFTLIKVIIGLENRTTELVESEDIHHYHQITTNISTFDSEVTIEIVEEASHPATEEVQATTTPGSLNQDFLFVDVPNFEIEETSNRIRKNAFKVMIATQGYSRTTRPSTSETRSTKTTEKSWWLSRLRNIRKKTSTVLTATTTLNMVTETSTPQYLDYEATTTPTIFAYTAETTLIPSETYNEDTSTAPSPSVTSVTSPTTLLSYSSTVSSSIKEATTLSSSQLVTEQTEGYIYTDTIKVEFETETNETEADIETESIETDADIETESIETDAIIETESIETAPDQHKLQVPSSQLELETEPEMTERSTVYKVYRSEKALYLLALIIPCLLLVVLVVVWLYLRRRKLWGRREELKMYEAGSVEEERLMTMKTAIPHSARQSLPNISVEMKDEIHYNSLAELSSSSRGDSPKQFYDADCARKRWQSDGNEVDSVDSFLTEAVRWRSEDWEKDQSFMTMLARRLEVVDSKAEITEL